MTPDFKLDKVRLFNCDCMAFMVKKPDNYYDLAIIDPPYGIGADKKNSDGAKKSLKSAKESNDYGKQVWDNNIPEDSYFKELFRISKHQIIWGANYFGLSGGMIYWHKNVSMPTYSDGELAYCSKITKVQYFEFTWHGMIQNNMKEKERRIHPTQKPIQLYKWLLTNYAKPNDKIFDSHGGSFSSACAALDMRFEFDGCELDKDYFDSAVNRIRNHSQLYIDLS